MTTPKRTPAELLWEKLELCEDQEQWLVVVEAALREAADAARAEEKEIRVLQAAAANEAIRLANKRADTARREEAAEWERDVREFPASCQWKEYAKTVCDEILRRRGVKP